MKTTRIIVSSIFLIAGGALLMSVVQGLMGAQNDLGMLLWNSYSYAAFGAPLLFFWIFAVLLFGRTHLYRLVSPMLVVVPLLLFGIAFNIMFWQPPSAVPPFWVTVQLFGRSASVVFWFFMGSVFMVCIAIFHAMCASIAQKNTLSVRGGAAANIKNAVSENYKKLTTVLRKVTDEATKSATLSTEQEPHAAADEAAQETTTEAATHNENTYNTMKVETHAQNHAGAQYKPEVRVMRPQDDRYLLIFNRDKLRDAQDIKLHQELEEETIQDVVPLGAEGYIASDLAMNYVRDGSHDEAHYYEHASDEWASTFENAPDVYQELGRSEDEESFVPHLVSDEEEFTDPSFLDETASESAVAMEDEEAEDKKKLSLKRAYEHTTEIHDEAVAYDEYPNDAQSMDDAPVTARSEFTLTRNVAHEFSGLAPAPKKQNKKTGKYLIPIHGVLNPPSEESVVDVQAVESIGKKLEETLKEFAIDAKVTSYCRGPVVTMFEILPAPGVRLSRIVALSDNIALRLAASSIRIVAPIPGKEAVGIEVPNTVRDVVSLSELIANKKFHSKDTALPLVLGKDVAGSVQVSDLSRMPHLLIAGATGSGKSVCINTLLCSLLFRCDPTELKLLLIDPKTVELNFYNDIAHLLTPVIDDPERSVQALRWCVEEMERRYQRLGAHGVREIRSYNAKMASQNVAKAARMPYLVIVIDEFADLMLTCSKEIETLVARIAAKSRAVGIHLVLATQRPSTDVITGIIKANIPSRIAFMVASKTDSRIILDQNGADKLLGRGDMLFSSASDLYPLRIQGAFLSEEEVSRVVSHVKAVGGEPDYVDEDELFSDGEDMRESYEGSEDPLWNDAVREVRDTNKASASYLQRRFRIGYNRASRLIETMEMQGIIGPQQGSKPRSVISSAA